ncbi:Bicyclomycin resistance protein [Thalassocella blandensis]|nr:Bicyclomycin resistance protein [Thalassocella blandensis]
MSQFRLAFPLAFTIAIVPFAVDTYLPSFPVMADYFSVSVHDIGLTVAIYVFALAFGQLIGGPLADKFGRQQIMFIGLGVFILSSAIISQLQSYNQLLIFRALQAFGGGWVAVCIPALARDKTEGIETAKLFSLIGLIMVAAPAIAPAIGGALLTWKDWNSIFVFLAAYAVLAAVVLKLTLFNRKHDHSQQEHDAEISRTQELAFFSRYLAVIRVRPALRFIGIQILTFSIMLLFITHASFIYQQHFAVSTSGFSLLFAANIVAMWCVMMLNRFLLNRFNPFSILRVALFIQALAVLFNFVLSQTALSLWTFAPCLILTVGITGACSPNSQACYMQYFKINGGTAAALMGAMQFGFSGLISGLSNLMPESITGVILAQLVCSLLAVLLVLWPARPAVEK